MRGILPLILAISSVSAQNNPAIEAGKLEHQGDPAGARALLRTAVQNSPHDLSAVLAYAEFLDTHRDPDTRPAYEKALALLSGPSHRAQAGRVTRRLLILDAVAGDREAAARHYEMFKAAGGTELSIDTIRQPKQPPKPATANIPGPLRSFARMAALSPDLEPGELLPALARNIVTNGYQAASSNEALEQTEFLKLVVRYLSQARELEKLAGAGHTIRIENCDSPQAGDLLRILGYRMRGGCGSEVVLETVNATRAFLTIDSGFPIAQLEQDLRTNRPFVYDFQPTSVPVLYGADFWLTTKDKQQQGEFIDFFLSDPSLCRLYLGLSKLDPETAEELKKAMPPPRLKAFAHVLDFYGGMFEIRNGHAVIPGGPQAGAAWKELAGVAPEQGAAFFERIITRDDGWMASFYDSLARMSGPTRDYLTDPKRMQRYYAAIRGKVTSPGPARPVFRANTDMLLLSQRLRLESDGRPHIPGSLEVWRRLFVEHPHGKYDGKLTKLANTWKEPDDLIEALFALCRKSVENEPLKMYMALSDVNRLRAKPLEPATVERMIRDYRTTGSQFAILAEAHALSDKTILQYLDSAQSVMKTRDQALRADMAGTLQGLVGIWQIFIRQGSIPAAEADSTLAGILTEFAAVKGDRELFDAGHRGTKLLLAASGQADAASPQDRLIDLLAGSAKSNDAESHRRVVQNMIQVFEAQRLVSLDTLFALADHLESLTKGEKLNPALVNKLAARISEIQLPRAALSTIEKNSLSFGYWTEKHVEGQRKVNLRVAIERAGSDPEKLRDIRGQLAPFLRDSIVGLNYAHYAPPGAQVLQTNPLFVRSHDFLGLQGSNQTWRTTEVFGTGWPSNAGGRLVGSLAGLPYALAEAEQNFLIPTREQALIWGDLVPQMILSAKIPRWWSVTPAQLHWVALHMRQAESLIAESALNPQRRAAIIELLQRQAPPARVRRVADYLESGLVREALDSVTPSEMFLLSADWWKAHPDFPESFAVEARRIASESPNEANYAAISRAFGTPKPTLANSYRPELLNLRTFPTLMGYSSRIMAESWESSLLYYAALADEMHMAPTQLNVVVPEWTQMTVEKIFATHLEDWPALLRSLRLVGEDVRMKAQGNGRASAGGAE